MTVAPATPRNPALRNLRVEYSPALQSLLQQVSENDYARKVARRFVDRAMPELDAPNPFRTGFFDAGAAAWFVSPERGDYNVRRRKLRDRVHALVLERREAREAAKHAAPLKTKRAA